MDELLKRAQAFRACSLAQPQHDNLFKSSRHEDVLRDIRDIQSQWELERAMTNMGRMQPFLTSMEHLEKVLITFDSPNTTEVMACVWGPVRFLLYTTNPTDRAFNCILDVYEALGSQIPALFQYTWLFKSAPKMLVYIYEDILEFHGLAYKLFSLRSDLWQKLYRSIWKSLGHTFRHLGQSLRSHREFIEKCGTSLRDPQTTLSDAKGSGRKKLFLSFRKFRDAAKMQSRAKRHGREVKRSREIFAEDEKKRRAQEKKRVLKWISASEKTPLLHKQSQDRRISPDTGRWLFRRYRQVNDWMKLDQRPGSAIWLLGSKGCGKTVVASLLIDELQVLKTEEQNYASPTANKTYYFYCRNGELGLNTCLGILKGILHQMVNADDYLLPLCVEKCDAARGRRNLASTEMVKSLVETFFEYNIRQYVVIDGLNECQTADEWRQAAKFFMRQVSKCDSIRPGQLRVFFISELMPNLSRENIMPRDEACVLIRPDDNAADIVAYVRKRLEGFTMPAGPDRGSSLDDDTKQQIEKLICFHSQGMFLYACLCIEHLFQQQTMGAIRQISTNEILPEKLMELYEDLLGGVKATLLKMNHGKMHWQQAISMLGWLACAKRNLDWHELQAILSYNPDDQTVDFGSRMARLDAQKYLGPLAYVLSGGHIQIIHSTVRSFIIKSNHIDRQEVQCDLAIRCLRYLCLLSSSNLDNNATRRQKARLGWFSFQDYACSYWQDHISTLVKDCSSLFHANNTRSRKYSRRLGDALREFVGLHLADLRFEANPKLPQSLDELADFSGLPFYQDLCVLWKHVGLYERTTHYAILTTGIQPVDEALQKNRAIIETELTPNTSASRNDKVVDYYGANLFKCGHLLCRFFYLGFDGARDRDAHTAEHERPYTCPIDNCSFGPLGFASGKDRDRHVWIHHQDPWPGPSYIKALQQRQEEQRFACKLCSRDFASKISLDGHERSHSGTRPRRI